MKFLELNECYKGEGWVSCRELIGSLFPENFTIEKNVFRTTRVNEVLEQIWMINKSLFENKKGIKKDIPSLSRQVALKGKFSNHFVDDLSKLVSKEYNLFL